MSRADKLYGLLAEPTFTGKFSYGGVTLDLGELIAAARDLVESRDNYVCDDQLGTIDEAIERLRAALPAQPGFPLNLATATGAELDRHLYGAARPAGMPDELLRALIRNYSFADLLRILNNWKPPT